MGAHPGPPPGLPGPSPCPPHVPILGPSPGPPLDHLPKLFLDCLLHLLLGVPVDTPGTSSWTSSRTSYWDSSWASFRNSSWTSEPRPGPPPGLPRGPPPGLPHGLPPGSPSGPPFRTPSFLPPLPSPSFASLPPPFPPSLPASSSSSPPPPPPPPTPRFGTPEPPPETPPFCFFVHRRGNSESHFFQHSRPGLGVPKKRPKMVTIFGNHFWPLFWWVCLGGDFKFHPKVVTNFGPRQGYQKWLPMLVGFLLKSRIGTLSKVTFVAPGTHRWRYHTLAMWHCLHLSVSVSVFVSVSVSISVPVAVVVASSISFCLSR